MSVFTWSFVGRFLTRCGDSSYVSRPGPGSLPQGSPRSRRRTALPSAGTRGAAPLRSVRSFLAPLVAVIVMVPASAAAIGTGLAVTGLAVAALAASAPPAAAVDDGLARTPPMGYNNWNATHCNADFNEGFVKATADFFVSSGLKAAGYSYVNLDDC